MRASVVTQHILIVEDEAKIALLLSDYLTQYGQFSCDILNDGDLVLAYLETRQPDLILLDVMLPGQDGLSLAKTIGSSTNIPFVMVTARVEEIDRLLGLELGADDYICKPFSPREVVARVKNILRRASGKATPGDVQLQINETSYTAVLNGQTLKLTPVEFALLSHLSKRPGQVFSRDQMMKQIYQDYRIVNDRTVDTHVKNLRRKLTEAAPKEELIESVYGVGYRFIG